MDVLRECLQGELLQGGVVETISSRPEESPALSSEPPLYGERAAVTTTLYAFTRMEELVPLGPEAVSTAIPRSSVEVLEAVQASGVDFLCIDPTGQRCLISAENVRSMLRTPRNVPVKTALAIEDGKKRKTEVKRALSLGGSLLQLRRWNSEGQYQQLTTSMPDGGVAALAFTSELEIRVKHDSGEFVETPVRTIVEEVKSGEFAGLVINPGGPWIALNARDLAGVR